MTHQDCSIMYYVNRLGSTTYYSSPGFGAGLENPDVDHRLVSFLSRPIHNYTVHGIVCKM